MKNSLTRLYAPLICMLLLLIIILAEQVGPNFAVRAPVLDYLEASADASDSLNQEPDLLVLYHSGQTNEAAFVSQLTDTLDLLRMPYTTLDLAQRPLGNFNGFGSILLCSQHMDPLLEHMEALGGWIERGGHFGLMMSPANTNAFQIISRKLGVTECGGEYVEYSKIRFLTDLLPMYESGAVHDDISLRDNTLSVRLSEECTVHLETGDERRLPLLWERALGNGRVMVLNATLTGEKANRGLTLCALFALEDTIVYPIINAGMIFIDDFPAPQPEGTDERLMADFGYSIQGFFRNHWWPDMKRLVWTYGVRYTGVLVETYNDRVEPPFEPDTEDRSLLRYYASELIHAGGEIGLHGYNHMPLCPEGFPYRGENYRTWPSAENMALALRELYRYGRKSLPEASFATYVPPSNYLSGLGQKTLLETLPQVRTISGLYLYEAGVSALVQEFREESDGSVSVPRVTSGFEMDAYVRFVEAQELLLHGVFSHFIHPDDVLDDDRGGNLGWTRLYQSFSQSLEQLSRNYPMLRYSTASEGAAAVQRYDRLNVAREWDGGTLTLTLSPFVDEAWLALRTRTDEAFTVEGGKGYPINDHFAWIHAVSDQVRISWEVKK